MKFMGILGSGALESSMQDNGKYFLCWCRGEYLMDMEKTSILMEAFMKEVSWMECHMGMEDL